MMPGDQSEYDKPADRDGIELAVFAEQVGLLCHQRAVIPVNLVIAGGTAAAVWPLYPSWVLALWLELFCAVTLGRLLLGYRYRRRNATGNAESAQRWARLFTLGAILTGCLWGLAGSIVFMTSDPVDHVFVLFVLGGLMAAGIAGNAVHLPAMFGFMLPSVLPMIVVLVGLGTLRAMEMAFMLAAFTAVLVTVGLNIHKSAIQNLRLRIEQDSVATKLRESEAALAQAQAIAHIGSWEVDLDSNRLEWSAEIFRILGLDPARYQPSLETMSGLVHPDDRQAFDKYYTDAVATGTLHTLDHRVVTGDGTIKWVHEIARGTPNAEGSPSRLFGTTQDITESKTTHNDLQFANILLTTEMEASPEGILVVGVNQEIISFNRQFADMWQIPPSNLTAGPDNPVLAKVGSLMKQRRKFLTRVQYLYDHPDEASFDQLETTDGRFIDRHTRGLRAPDGEHLGRVWFFHDVTATRETANALRYRDELLNAVTVGTSILLKSETLDQEMPEALRVVGETLRADRVLVTQGSPGHKSPPVLRHIWQSRDVPVSIDPSVFESIANDFAIVGTWGRQLGAGKPVIVQHATSDGPIRAILERSQSKSLLLVPIRVDNKTWGALGIDMCKVAREWTAHEIGTLKIFADITGSLIRRNETRLSLELSEERFRVLVTSAQDAIITMSGTGLISRWNRSAERLLGYSAEEARGRGVHDFMVPARFNKRAAQSLKTFLATGKGDAVGKTLELAALRKDGTEVEVELSLAGANIGGSWQAMAILRDITERKRSEQQLLQMSRFDMLTGLANRDVFVEALEHAIAKARRGEKGFAVIYLDLDHFKDVNDTLGHPVGDGLLKAMAERLRTSSRDVDIVARFGGDEFALVAADISEPADAAILAEKLIKAIGKPFSIDGNEIHTGASVGIDLYGPQAPDAETLLSHADVALYRAKSEGRGIYRFFTEAMDAEVRTRVTLETELRAAISSGQLFLLYQPQVEIDSGMVIGLEALVRWHHPTRGILGPDKFIRVAEKSGAIVKLGQWVLATACQQAKAWLDAGTTATRVSVNLSPLQFKTPLELEDEVATVLRKTGLPSRFLELELTETALMDVSQAFSQTLEKFRQIGTTIAIDDFGTGYSSLDYLRRFPVDRIKIAQNFVRQLATVGSDAAIVKATIGLARELGIAVIAEGVETQGQLELLKGWGCREVQGFYFAKPLAADVVTRILLDGGIIGPAARPLEEAAAQTVQPGAAASRRPSK